MKVCPIERGNNLGENLWEIVQGGEVYDAEIIRATMALLAAITTKRGAERIFVLLDNQAAVSALKTRTSTSYLQITRKFNAIAQKVNAVVRWVPGHSHIPGNEEADTEARAALHLLPL